MAYKMYGKKRFFQMFDTNEVSALRNDASHIDFTNKNSFSSRRSNQRIIKKSNEVLKTSSNSDEISIKADDRLVRPYQSERKLEGMLDHESSHTSSSSDFSTSSRLSASCPVNRGEMRSIIEAIRSDIDYISERIHKTQKLKEEGNFERQQQYMLLKWAAMSAKREDRQHFRRALTRATAA